MADIAITLKAKVLKKYLAKMSKKMRIPSKLLRPIANIYAFKDIVDHFNKQKGNKGRWRKRSSFTQQYYRAIQVGELAPPKGQSRAQYNPANKILQMTGTLRNSLRQGSAKRYSKDSVIIRSNVAYSGIHDKGGKKDGHRIPARPFMWLSNKATKSIYRAVLHEIAK